jgi:ligand-binding sensor domain-containing protein/signal transduction histidine kinase
LRSCKRALIGHSARLSALLVVLFCCFMPVQPAHALDPNKAITQYVHTVWRTDDGLPQTSVMKIIQTRDGYLWVGTQNGIGRFDGVHFTTFDRSNTPMLHDNRISDLIEDRSGMLWIATSHGGLTSFRDGVFTHFDGIPDLGARTLAADPDGSIWVGGSGGVAHVRNGRVIKRYTMANGLSGDAVSRVLVDNQKSIWIATAGGLDRLNSGKIQSYSTKDGLPNRNVIDLHLAADNRLWVKTQGSDLVQLAGGRSGTWKIKNVPGADIHDMLEDRNGNIWIASTTQGLLRVRGQQVSRYSMQNGLSNDEAMCLYEDRDGNLWIGTNVGGLDRLRDGNLTTFATEEGLVADRTHSVTGDNAGNIWVTTSSGLSRLGGPKASIFTVVNGLPTNNVLSLHVDLNQNLLIGTSNAGLIQMKAGRFSRRLRIEDGIPAFPITGILEGPARDLWLATQGGGLTHFQNGRMQNYSKSNGLQSNGLFGVIQGADGTIWIGTNDGLNSISDGKIASYLSQGEPGHATIITMFFDARRILWIGTLERGLFRYENGHFTQYTTQLGLPDDTIGNILDDAAGNLWIGSNSGISRLDRRDLDAVATGSGHFVHSIVFGKADGMKTADLNSGTQPNAWRARDGRLWFPTLKGVVVVDPAHLSLDTHAPSPRIEKLVADDIVLDLAAPIALRPGTRRVEIHYTAPNLSSPERMRFRYRLDGFDQKWVTGGNQRVANYSNLAPGRYVFRVNTSVEAGKWSDHETALTFDLLPRFYQTWWFRALCGLVIVVAAWAAYRLRVNWLHAKAGVLEERQRIAREIHDSLAQGLSGIIFQTEAALMSMTHEPDMTSSHVTSARELAMSSLDEARYSVANLSPPTVHRGLEETLSSITGQLARGRAEELDIRASGTPWMIGPEATHHVVSIVKEAVSNAIQHGRARKITISLNFALDEMLVCVSDDGLGFHRYPQAQNSERGYGMGNMNYRAQSLGSRLEIDSELGKGTVISLRVPRASSLLRLWRGFLGAGVARIDN